MRPIKKIHADKPSHWVGDGFRVRTLFSHLATDTDFNYRHTDPFLLLDYAAPKIFAPNLYYDTHPYGVGRHPHKGFETVTIAYAGELSHADSAGGSGTISKGDVQWMTAGRGIIHEEFHSPAFGQHGGVLSMLQLWINLPQAHKLTHPNYQTLKRSNMAVVDLTAGPVTNAINTLNHDASSIIINHNHNKNVIGKLTLIAGTYQGATGIASTFTPINLWDIELWAAGTVDLDIANTHNVLLLVQQGELFINDSVVSAGHLIQFEAASSPLTATPKAELTDIIKLTYAPSAQSETASKKVKLLLLSGEPIGEAIAAHGPFVMTTQDELKQTFCDYQNGSFI